MSKSPPPLPFLLTDRSNDLTFHTGHGSQRASVGSKLGMHILGLIIALLLARQIYLTITVGKIQDEGVWYPLAALTELIAVFLFSAPGLVPDKKDLIETHDKDPDSTSMN